MKERTDFRIVLLKGGSAKWSDSVTPLLLRLTDCLTVVERADELLSIPPAARPEMIVICHQPGVFDGISEADQVREHFPVTSLVLLAAENIITLKAALSIGALAIVEPPFAEEDLADAYNRCRRQADALREEILKLSAIEPGIDIGAESVFGTDSSAEWLESTGYSDETDAEPFPPPCLTEDNAQTASSAMVSEPTTSHDSLSTLRVLVAEDVPILQTAITQHLERIGCQFVIVGNGKEVLDELEKGTFDVILMDLRMPVMDGFEATRLIRSREQITGGRIPVVALSSYSLQEIQDKCLEIGMDSYLVKPVDRKKLEATLRWLKNPQEALKQSGAITSGLDGLPVLEPHPIIQNLDFDLELYWELVDIYLTTCAELGDELAEILSENDIKKIFDSAHSLKGIVANIGGKRLEEVASQIQEMCRKENKPAATVWAPLVKAESAALKAALETISWEELRKFAADQQT